MKKNIVWIPALAWALTNSAFADEHLPKSSKDVEKTEKIKMAPTLDELIRMTSISEIPAKGPMVEAVVSAHKGSGTSDGRTGDTNYAYEQDASSKSILGLIRIPGLPTAIFASISKSNSESKQKGEPRESYSSKSSYLNKTIGAIHHLGNLSLSLAFSNDRYKETGPEEERRLFGDRVRHQLNEWVLGSTLRPNSKMTFGLEVTSGDKDVRQDAFGSENIENTAQTTTLYSKVYIADNFGILGSVARLDHDFSEKEKRKGNQDFNVYSLGWMADLGPVGLTQEFATRSNSSPNGKDKPLTVTSSLSIADQHFHASLTHMYLENTTTSSSENSRSNYKSNDYIVSLGTGF